MRSFDPGEEFRSGYEPAPSPYIQWGMIEEVLQDDVSYSQLDLNGNLQRNIPVTYARSVVVRWLHSQGGRTSVRYLEPIGNTSMPMKGTVVAVGFIGGPKGEPVILGAWTQGFKSRIPEEFGNLRPGQEVWRRSGLRFRIIPNYEDLRYFSEQYKAAPWTLDLIMGEQHDNACFCPICQTRYPTITVNGKPACASECAVCKENKRASKLVLVKGSIAAGEGDAWLAVQSQIVVNSALLGTFNTIDEQVIGKYITDISMQQVVRDELRIILYNQVGPVWEKDVSAYYSNEINSYWTEMITEYFEVGSLNSWSPQANTNIVGSQLCNRFNLLVNTWIQTTLYSYLTNSGMSSSERDALITAMRNSLTTYVTTYLPYQLMENVKNYIYNKFNSYVSETIATLRRKLSSWVYKQILSNIKSAALKAVKDRLGLDFQGLKDGISKISGAITAVEETIAYNAVTAAISKAVSLGIQDPEELPILELRGDQDLRAVVDPQAGREVGQGQKAPRLRLKIYRDGAIKLQVQDKATINIDSDGNVELDCANINIDASQLQAALEKESTINLQEILNIGNTKSEMKSVTLDEDNVRELRSTLGTSTRDFVERVAWKYIAGKLITLLPTTAVTFTDGSAALAVKLGLDFDYLLPGPPQNSVIGKTESSAEHLKGN